jgi:hexosaminidase
MAMAPLIVPAPQQVDVTDRYLPGDLAVAERPDPSLPAQGYELILTDGGVTLAHADRAGLRYGRSSLAQLRAQGLVAGRIRDWPDLEHRGFVLDISRDRVPDRACLSVLLDRLDRLRINHLELYTEHTFAYADHEVVWHEASPMTAEDVAWLDAEAAARGIELVANQNTFGHFERWLRLPEYRGRAADPSVAEPRSLAPTEANARFALDLVAELTGHHTSRQVNIGCDEVFELHGQKAAFVEHLGRLLDGSRALGLHPRFWADMIHGDPAAARDVVGDATALLWHYEAPMSGGAEDLMRHLELPSPFDAVIQDWLDSGAHRGFGPRAEHFGGSGIDWWVCPGTSGWNSLVGRWSNARANALDAVAAAADHGASGMLVTEWGDNGHLQPPTVMLPALTFAASVAWARAANEDQDTAAALDAWVLPDAASRAGAALLEAGEVYARTGVIQPNGSALHDAVAGGGMGGFGEPTAAALAGVEATLADADEALAAARFVDADAAIVRRELRQAVALARHGARRLAHAHRLSAPDLAALAGELAALREEQAACWNARSRPGGREDSLARLQDI